MRGGGGVCIPGCIGIILYCGLRQSRLVCPHIQVTIQVLLVAVRVRVLSDNKNHYRRPPPLSRLETGTVRVQTVTEFSSRHLVWDIVYSFRFTPF